MKKENFGLFILSAFTAIAFGVLYLLLYVASFAIPIIIIVYVLRWLGVIG